MSRRSTSVGTGETAATTPRRLRVALDFDGVLHSYGQGFTGATDLPGEPVPGALDFVRAVVAAGHSAVVFSCRARTIEQASESEPWMVWDHGGRDAVLDWLEKWGFPAMPVTGVKPIADVYLDDYGYRFEGRWPSVAKLEKLRPWYRNGKRALTTLFDGGAEREQEILTPSCITDFVRDIFGGPIMLDPCAAVDGTGNTVRADFIYTGPPGGADGLVEPWRDRTFCNPPFGKLKAWLAKATYEATTSAHRIVVLCPVRSRSEWWRTDRDLCKMFGGSYVELNRLAFVGYQHTFPESLALFCYNVPEMTVGRWLEKHPIGGMA